MAALQAVHTTKAWTWDGARTLAGALRFLKGATPPAPAEPDQPSGKKPSSIQARSPNSPSCGLRARKRVWTRRDEEPSVQPLLVTLARQSGLPATLPAT